VKRLNARSLAEEVASFLDRLRSSVPEARREAAAGLARLGVWTRGNTLPRGTAWAAAPVTLPYPHRLGELLSAATDADPEVQSQIIAALGHWGDESVARSIGELFRSSHDESLRLYCVIALGTLGGPMAVEALVDAARDESVAVAQAALQRLEALLTGGGTDDTTKPSSIRQPPDAFVPPFSTTLEQITTALANIVADKSRSPVHSRARDLLSLVQRRRVVRVTARRLDDLLKEVENVPETPVGEHLDDDQLFAYANNEITEGDRAPVERHLASCGDCSSQVEDLIEAAAPWRGPAGEARLHAFVAKIRAAREEKPDVVPDETPSKRDRAAAAILSFSAGRRAFAAQVGGAFSSSLRSQFDELRGQAGRAAVAFAAAGERRWYEAETEDGTLQRRTFVDEDGSLVVRLGSQDPTREGVRLAVTMGGLRRESTLTRVAKDRWLAEVVFVHDEWSALPDVVDVSVEVLASSLSPDRRRIASGGSDHLVRVWDAETEVLVAAAEGHTALVTSVAWSPHGQWVASGGGDRTVRVWDAPTGAAVAIAEGHTGSVTCVAWSPDVRHIASGSDDRTVRVWEAVTGAAVATAEGHSQWVTSVAWSPEGRWVASGSGDGTVRVWEARTGAAVAVCAGHTASVIDVAFSPDGRRIVSRALDGVTLTCEAATGATIEETGEQQED
jgi:hypothetical protein